MSAKKYIVRNGVKMPIEKAMKVAELRMRGYTFAKIAEMTDLTEADVVNILNVNRD